MVARPYSAYTVGDLMRLNKGFMRKYAEPEKIDEQLRYVQSIAQSNPMIINAKYLDLLCFEGDKTRPILERGLINKALFEYLAEFKAPSTEGQIALLDSIAEQFTTEYAVNDEVEMRGEIDSIARNIGDNIDDINRHEEEILDFQRRINEYNKRIDALEVQLDNIGTEEPTEHWVLTEVRKIVAAGDWEYIGRNDNILYLKSAASVMCRYSLPAAGVDKSLDFGRFLLKINQEGKMSVFGIENTISPVGNCSAEHPHINSGSICWGNMRSKVHDLRIGKQLLPAVQILNQLLRDYSPSAPYRSFNSFSRRQKDRVTMPYNRLASKFCEVVARHFYPDHKTFDELYEVDPTRDVDSIVSGDIVKTVGGFHCEIRELTPNSSFNDFSYIRLSDSSARVRADSFNRLRQIYKLRELQNDETINQEAAEESTEASSGSRESSEELGQDSPPPFDSLYPVLEDGRTMLSSGEILS